jgi:adiponectin receptor
LMNHSPDVEYLCLRLDMLGIVIFILGDLMLGIYIVFWCEPFARRSYWSMVSFSSPAGYWILTLVFRFLDRNFRDVNNLHDNKSQIPGPQVSYLPSDDVRGDWLDRSCALDAWTQCLRPVADDGESSPLYSGKSSLPSLWDSILCSESPEFATREESILRHVVLKTRFPESRYPGKFDLLGSHSIFHILVVCAAVVQLMGYLDAFDYAQVNLACSPI